MTQIKGWREKFTPAEAPPTPTPPTAEGVCVRGPEVHLPGGDAGPDVPQCVTPRLTSAAAGCEAQKKNLSAFCSDMLDQYLENEGRLIDERASTFSQPVVDLAPPPAYELPARSSSYVRTLHSVMQKQGGSSTSELISAFVPPSKRPKPSLKETRTSRRDPSKPRGPRPGRPRPRPGDSDVNHHPDPLPAEAPPP